MSDQGQRILDATIEVAGREGYGGTTVARIVGAAGVSRTTFYDCFRDREDCFLEAARRLIQSIEGRLECLQAQAPADALAAALAAAERQPAVARVLLIELLGAPSAVRFEYERLLNGLALRIDRIGGDWFADGSRPGLPTRALLGGIGGVIALRALSDKADGLTALGPDLLAWASSYALDSPPGVEELDWREAGRRVRRELAPPPPLRAILDEGRQPRGGGAASSLMAERQRTRVLAAAAWLCCERGYAAIRVADIAAAASVTREAFYRHFRGKEDAVLTAQAWGMEQCVSFSASRFFGEEAWPDRVWSGLEATLTWVSAQPDFVFVDLVESYAAGSAAIRRAFENRLAFTFFLEQGFQERSTPRDLPRISTEAIAGAISELLRREVVAGRAGQLLSLLPLTAYLALAPFLGAGAALEFVEAKLESR